MSNDRPEPGVLSVGGLAAILASTCCLGPLVLVSVGLGGAWVSNLQALEPFRLAFIAAALIALLLAWKRIYRDPAACGSGDVCALPAARRGYQAIFWLVAALVLVALTFPYVVPFFY